MDLLYEPSHKQDTHYGIYYTSSVAQHIIEKNTNESPARVNPWTQGPQVNILLTELNPTLLKIIKPCDYNKRGCADRLFSQRRVLNELSHNIDSHLFPCLYPSN